MQQSWNALEVKGKDAKDFLQRLTTIAMARVPVGMGTRGLLLNPMSKVLGSFTLLATAAETYILVFESNEEFTRVTAEFERLHFSEKIEFSKIPGAGGIAADLSSPVESAPIFPIQIGEKLFSWPSFLPGRMAVFGEPLPKLLSEEESQEERILAGEPKWGAEISPESNALDVGLLSWIHENKGCYPGQEVVERSLSVGHPARVLVKLEVLGGAKIGNPLLADGKEVGKVTSVSPRGISALGIVQWKYRDHVVFSSGEGELRCRK